MPGGTPGMIESVFITDPDETTVVFILTMSLFQVSRVTGHKYR